MTSKLVLYGLLVFVLNGTQVQDNSIGIYITIKKNNKKHDACQKELFSRDRKVSACVPLRPIVFLEDFVSITEITYDEQKKNSYFTVTLSPDGFAKLKNITSKLPLNDLAFIVDDTVVALIQNVNQLVNRGFEVDGPLNSPDLLWVHERLKKRIKLKK